MFIRNFNKLLKYKHFDLMILSALFLIALLLRAYMIDKNLFFGPEQGRDMLVVRDIVVHHKLVLIGPRTAVDGIFHGPLYYYLAAIPFTLSRGNPIVIELFFILLNSSSVFFIYLAGKEFFQRKVGLLASLLFTFSFGAVVMSRWLSHPPLIIPLSCLFFLFLYRFLKGKSFYLLPAALMFGLASQTEFTDFLIFSFVLLCFAFIFWKKITSQGLIFIIFCTLLLVIGSIGNFVLFDLRHNFLIKESFIRLLTGSSGFYGSYSGSISNSVSSFTSMFSDSVVPSYPIIGLIIFISGLILIFKSIKKIRTSILLLSLWIISPFVVFILLKYNPLYHYFTAMITGIIIFVAVLIDKLWSYKKMLGIVFTLALIFVNLYAWAIYLPTNKNVFFQSTQPDLKYSDQKSVIRRIYKEANGKPFYFQSYTIPYWLQEEWEYLFWYFGTNVYGYVPIDKDEKLLFVIIQDDPSNKIYQNNWLKNTVSTWGTKENEFRYGALKVEKLQVK